MVQAHVRLSQISQSLRLPLFVIVLLLCLGARLLQKVAEKGRDQGRDIKHHNWDVVFNAIYRNYSTILIHQHVCGPEIHLQVEPCVYVLIMGADNQ